MNCSFVGLWRFDSASFSSWSPSVCRLIAQADVGVQLEREKKACIYIEIYM